MFGCNEKYSFPEIVFLLTRIYAFDLEMNLRSHFHFNSFPERERERERKERAQIRERVREERAQIGEHRSSIALLVGRSHRTDERRDRQARSMGSRGAIDEIASIVGAGFGLMRSHRSSSLVVRMIASLRSELSLLSRSVIHFLLLGFGFIDDFFLGCGLCSGFVFSFFFSKHHKIFSGKFFEIQPSTMETFSFSGN